MSFEGSEESGGATAVKSLGESGRILEDAKKEETYEGEVEEGERRYRDNGESNLSVKFAKCR